MYKITSKRIVDQIQYYNKNNIYNDQYDLWQYCKVDLYKETNVIQHIEEKIEKNLKIILLHAEKAFGKIQHPFLIKSFSKLIIERKRFSWVKNSYYNL